MKGGHKKSTGLDTSGGSTRLPKQKVKNVKGGDKLQAAAKRAGSKHSY